MSQLPSNRREMLRAAYHFVAAKPCNKCGVLVEIWRTTNGKIMLFDPPPVDAEYPEMVRAQVHFPNCRPPRQPSSADSADGRLQAVRQFAGKYQARVVLLLQEGGYTWAAKPGLTPEDVKHELITAANAIRRDMGGNNGTR